jgi:endonuclease YncB( thermonuclease family)
VTLAFLAWLLVSGPAADRRAPRADVASGAAFTCTVTRVHDGDGPIHCREGQRIRLSGIAARELDETCSEGHPCPEASGASARAALDRLTRGQALRCTAEGSSYNRIVATCETGAGVDLACAMIGSGTVLRWARYDRAGRLADCWSTGKRG